MPKPRFRSIFPLSTWPTATKLITRRHFLTQTVSPPLCSTVPEKPYTVVLQEDRNFYNSSWHCLFNESFPKHFSTEYCYQELELKHLNSSLLEMSEDLRSLPSVVLVARGPLVSLVAQFYLESLPLSGLVMVDPFVEPGGIISQHIGNTSTDDVGIFTQIEQVVEKRELKLEPGVVPMLVLMSLRNNEQIRKQSKLTAQRHHDPQGLFGVQIDYVGDNPVDKIQTWIENEIS